MKTSSASDGIVCTTPAMARMPDPSRGRRAATMPSGIATRIAAASEIPTRARCSRRGAATGVPPGPSTTTCESTPRLRREELGGDAVLRNPIDLRPRIHRGHLGGRDLALQASEHRDGRGGPGRQVGPIEPDAFIGREELPIVLQHAEVVGPDLGVGRVELGGLDLAGGEGAIRQVVVEPPHVALREAVPVPQAGPAVGPLHEFVAEAELEFRMAPQVGERPDAQAGGHVLRACRSRRCRRIPAAGSSRRRARASAARAPPRRGSSCRPGSRR